MTCGLASIPKKKEYYTPGIDSRKLLLYYIFKRGFKIRCRLKQIRFIAVLFCLSPLGIYKG